MRKIRFIVALLIAFTLGFLAVKLISHYFLNKPKSIKVQNISKEQVQKKKIVSDIPAGMRVIALSFKILPALKPGDMVDVIATNLLPGKNEKRISRIILENIKVFKTDKASAGASRYIKSKRNNFISLLVTPENAGILTAALKTAEITLIRRKKISNINNSADNTSSFIYSKTFGSIISHGKNKNFSLIIPRNMRAVTIGIKDTDGLCGVLKQGDRVDIIITCPYSKFASGGLAPGSKGQITRYRIGARMLAQDLEVLANEASLVPNSAPDAPVRNITLAVTPQQAVILTASTDATKKSSIKLILRGKSDRSRPNTSPVNTSDLLTEKRIFRQVEIIKGTQVNLVPFFR